MTGVFSRSYAWLSIRVATDADPNHPVYILNYSRLVEIGEDSVLRWLWYSV